MTTRPQSAPFFRRSIALILGAAALACIEGEPGGRPVVTGGNPERGRELVWGYGCGGCHVIPGVADADATIGPPLTDWVERRYIAGNLTNAPENLIAWIMSPQAIEPSTAMPDLDVSEVDARHIAAYLYTIGNARPLGPPHPLPVDLLERLGEVSVPGGVP